MFWALCAASLLLCVLGLPLGDDRNSMSALNELRAFDTGFDRAALERALLSQASAQGMVALADIARGLGAPGLPKVSVAAAAPAITPRTEVQLNTLSDVNALAAAGATIGIGSPKAEALASALGWRLARRAPEAGADRYELQQIVLTDRACTSADLQREQTIADERLAAVNARNASVAAKTALAEAETLHEQRKKWKASRKAIQLANAARLEALAVSNSAVIALTQADARYAADAKLGEKLAAAPKGAGGCMLATATLLARPSAARIELILPTPIDQRRVTVPNLTGVDFPVLHAVSLWSVVEQQSAKDAIATLLSRFSWHYRYTQIGKIKLGGMTVLQFAPLLLLPLFSVLIRRSRGVGATYNPFDRTAGEVLPTVGLGVGALNLVALVLLPLTGCALCAVSLVGIDELPVVPVLCALSALGLGGRSHVALNELLELRDAVTLSHSHAPPPPDATAR
jgi:hypothetical protein